MNNQYGYGNWMAVFSAVFIFILFTIGFIRPKKKRDWRNYSIFVAYLVALFTEMFGIPLTVFLLVSALGNRYPTSHPFSFVYGHLLYTFLGKDTAVLYLIHIISNSLIIAGLVIMGKGWLLIYKSKGALVTQGIYKYIRHPQYLGLYLIMVAFLIQWPTLITLCMFPVLVYMYYRLSRQEEKELEGLFQEEFIKYRSKTPMFIPKFKEV